MMNAILFIVAIILAASDGEFFPLPNIAGLCLFLWIAFRDNMVHLADEKKPVEWEVTEEAIRASGGTYNEKDELRRMGFHWNHKRRAWEMPLKTK